MKRLKTAWRQRLVLGLIVLYLFLQTIVPAAGLHLAHENDRAYPFSWHMFSRVPQSGRE